MSGKVKITKSLAKAIEGALDECGSIDGVLANHDYDWIEECTPLNELNHHQLAIILINGYEVEQTPEDKIKEYYKYITDELEVATMDGENWNVLRNTKDTIKFVLDTLNIKIDGINDK